MAQLNLNDLQSYDGPLSSPAPLQQPDQEQRQSSRKPYAVKAVLGIDGKALAIETVDISLGGLCVRAAAQAPVGKNCQLCFPLPFSETLQASTFSVLVIYCFYTGENNFNIGLEFQDIAATDAEKIRRFAGA